MSNILKIFFLISIFLNYVNLGLNNKLKASNISNDSQDIHSSNEFNKNQKITSKYLLGPGDELFILFEGLRIYSKSYIIDPEGYLFLPELKNVFASGKSIKELEDELLMKFDKYIINPSIKIKVLNYRPVNIFLGGEVKNPGLYTLSYQTEKRFISDRFITYNEPGSELKSFERIPSGVSYSSPKLFDAIRMGEGLTSKADLSSIKVIRNNADSYGGGKITTNIDLIPLITTGDQKNNISIHDGDSIFIGKSEKSFKDQLLNINKTNLTPNKVDLFIQGNVSQRGMLEVPHGTTLVQAVAMSGPSDLSGKVEFIRFKDDGSVDKRLINYKNNMPRDAIFNPVLLDGDVIVVKRNLLGQTTKVLKEIANPVVTTIGLIEIFD